MKYYKCVQTSFKSASGIEFHTGHFNVDCKVYMTDIQHIFNYIEYGSIILELDNVVNPIYDGECMSIDGPEIPGWYSNEFDVVDFWDLFHNFTYYMTLLIAMGADPTTGNFILLQKALLYNRKGAKYIKENWSSIYKIDNISKYEHQLPEWEQVEKYLAERGFYY